jgi:hypothetical protein
MRAALALLALVAAAASRGGCGGPGDPAYDPCAGKACLDSCHLCAPGDPGCAETAELKVCNPGGRCVSWSPAVTCGVPDACAGKACGSACVIEAPCRFEDPPCMVPDVAGRCDARGACVAGDDVMACAP